MSPAATDSWPLDASLGRRAAVAGFYVSVSAIVLVLNYPPGVELLLIFSAIAGFGWHWRQADRHRGWRLCRDDKGWHLLSPAGDRHEAESRWRYRSAWLVALTVEAGALRLYPALTRFEQGPEGWRRLQLALKGDRQ